MSTFTVMTGPYMSTFTVMAGPYMSTFTVMTGPYMSTFTVMPPDQFHECVVPFTSSAAAYVRTPASRE